jgi:hypothetical protein
LSNQIPDMIACDIFSGLSGNAPYLGVGDVVQDSPELELDRPGPTVGAFSLGKCRRHRIAHEVHACRQATLSTLATLSLMPSEVGDHPLDAAHAATCKLVRGTGRKRFGLGVTKIQPQDLAPGIAVDADGDEHGDRDDSGDFDVCCVDPQIKIGPVALDRAVHEGLHLLVDFRTSAADLALGDSALGGAAHPHDLDRVIDQTGAATGTPCRYASLVKMPRKWP